MRISFSNIAWDPEEDPQVVELFQKAGIDAIDVAPGKYFPDPKTATPEEIDAVRTWWSSRGIEIVGMQALLFGTTGLNVFGSAESQEAMLAHLEGVCRVARGLGAPRLVFGSPKNRDRAGLDDDEALLIATDFFRRLGDIAAAHEVIICLEPNPVAYGANFMTTHAQTAAVVRNIAHRSVKMQLDTGALAMTGEDPLSALTDTASLVGHIHLSEPNLAPLGDGGTDHSAMFEAISGFLPGRTVSIEMVATKQENHLVSMKRALGAVQSVYGRAGA